MTVTNYNLNGFANNTDISAVGFNREYNTNSGDIIVNVDGKMDVVSSSQTMVTVDTGTADHSIEITYATATTSNSFPCCVCVTEYHTFYGVKYDNGGVGAGFYLTEFVSGSGSSIAGVAGSMSDGDRLKLSWIGGKLTAYKNGTAITGLINLDPLTTITASNKVGFHGRQSNTDLVDAFSVESFPPASITTVNSGNPVKVGSTFNSTVSGFTGAASGTMDSKALTGVSYTTNTITATLPSYVDGGTYFEPDTTQTLTLVNGSETANTESPTASPDGMDSVVLATPNMADSTYLTYWIPTATDDDRIVFPTEGGDFDVSETGRVTCSTAGARVLWHWNSENSVMTRLNVTVNEVGDVVGFGLTSSGLSGSGLTSSGLTSR